MSAYTYGVSEEINIGILNSFQSNHEVNPAIVPNTSESSYSNFDLRYRFILIYEYRLDMECTPQNLSSILLCGQFGQSLQLHLQQCQSQCLQQQIKGFTSSHPSGQRRCQSEKCNQGQSSRLLC